MRPVVLVVMVLVAACASAYTPKSPPPRPVARSPNPPQPPPANRPVLARNADIVSYRLPLRDNPNPRDAQHCYEACQSAKVPKRYLECLSECPGFQVVEGRACAPDDVPPVARCLTAHKVEKSDQVDPRLVVAEIAGFLLVFTLASVESPTYHQEPPH
jgi:hypothetical protein